MSSKVYFIEGKCRIKIGISTNVRKRLRELSRVRCEKLKLLGTVDGGETLERAIHKKLAAQRLDGEWFADCAEVRELIGLLLGGVPIQLSSESIGSFYEMVVHIWPDKAARRLFELGCASRRTCGSWAAGTTEPNATVLALLIQSEDGGRVCDYIFRDRPNWRTEMFNAKQRGTDAVWWLQLQRDRKQAAAARAFVRGMDSM